MLILAACSFNFSKAIRDLISNQHGVPILLTSFGLRERSAVLLSS